jgi:hypothetical protein
MSKREVLMLQQLFDGWKVSEDPASPGKFTLSITGLSHQTIRLIAALFALTSEEGGL